MGLTVLLADDNALNRKLVGFTLKRMGCDVLECANGKEAVQSHCESPRDVVLLDIMMPLMDGFQAAGAIRQNDADTGRRTLVIGLSSGDCTFDREKLMSCGMDTFLPKPFDENEFAKTVEKYLPGKTIP